MRAAPAAIKYWNCVTGYPFYSVGIKIKSEKHFKKFNHLYHYEFLYQIPTSSKLILYK